MKTVMFESLDKYRAFSIMDFIRWKHEIIDPNIPQPYRLSNLVPGNYLVVDFGDGTGIITISNKDDDKDYGDSIEANVLIFPIFDGIGWVKVILHREI